MRRRTITGVALLVLTTITTAGAAPMEHHDLASLWWESEHVVLAEEISRQYRVEEWNETVTYRVLEVLDGDLAVGDEVEVYDDAYRYDLPLRWDRSDPADPEPLPAPALEPQLFLFLRPAPPRQITETVRDEGPMMKVPSGMRVIANGKVYRFEQRSNPGAYAPVPQGPDPEDLFGKLAVVDPQPIALARFSVELAQGAARAERCERALAIEDPAARNAALLELLPPPRHWPPTTEMAWTGFAADALSREMQLTIARSGDLDAVVEAYGRDVVASFYSWDAGPFIYPDREARGQALLDAALDPARPVHQRTGALGIIAENTYAIRDRGRPALESIAGLLRDPEPAVRTAAVTALGSHAHGDQQAWAIETLLAAFEVEPHPVIQHTIAQWLRTRDAKADRLDPLLTGELAFVLGATAGPAPPDDGRELLLGYRYVIPHHEWSPQLTLHAVARGVDGTEHRSAAGEGLSASSGQGMGQSLFRFAFDPPLPPGRYAVTLDGHLEPYQTPNRSPADDTSNPVSLRVP